MANNDQKEQVRAAVDFLALVQETVELKPRAQGDYWGCCPFHHEKSPSFHVMPQTGLWHCFGCGKGGDVFDYVMARENMDFPEALRYLADRAGIELQYDKNFKKGSKRLRLLDACDAARDFYHMQLMRGKDQGCVQAREYLASRGFGAQIAKRWKLGYAPGKQVLMKHLRSLGFSMQEAQDANLVLQGAGGSKDRFYNRIMFPIANEQGRTIAFGGRVIGDAKPKYLNTSETQVFHKSKNLFAFDKAKEAIAAQKTAIVVEGYTDVISLHEAGFHNVVATLGTALTADHIRLLSRFAKTIVCSFDGDAAGQKAAESAVRYLEITDASIRCVVLPDNLDPAEFIAARGKDALMKEFSCAQPLMDFVFEKCLERYDLSVPGQRVHALQDIAKLLVPLKNSILLDEYALRLADALNTDATKVKSEVYHCATGQGEGTQTISSPTPVQPSASIHTKDKQEYMLECELIGFMLYDMQLVRMHEQRLAQITWITQDLQSIAWALLASDEKEPEALMKIAREASDKASAILQNVAYTHTSLEAKKQKIAYLVDAIELYSEQKEIKQLQARLRTETHQEKKNEVFCRVTKLQQHVTELMKKFQNSSIMEEKE